ncbi:hypothetical protein RM96_28525 [Cupriavidus sp. IDO]|nr:hypothetical protein RM96_28525 [Cupriavidus sp. IDO]
MVEELSLERASEPDRAACASGHSTHLLMLMLPVLPVPKLIQYRPRAAIALVIGIVAAFVAPVSLRPLVRSLRARNAAKQDMARLCAIFCVLVVPM